MSTDHADQGATPPLPTSIKVLAWTSLLGPVAPLLEEGVKQDTVSLVGSVVLGALLVGYISAGVVRARTVRLVIAWVVLSLTCFFGVVSLFYSDDVGEVAGTLLPLATSVVSLAALERFRHTDWYAWQRTKPSTRLGESIRWLVAIGVLVGALGGLVDRIDDPRETSVNMTLRVAER
ncbi:hypothetical protein [Nocardioides sp.]|uniref:hypothetical protein n=1 Tax=Nocardioides sp. TaxID=35761 RepID=UPI0035ADC41F